MLKERVIDDSLMVKDLYYRTFNEINGYILKILKENGKGDGNYAVLDYLDLGERGFLRREKFTLQYFNNDLDLMWQLDIPPETYLSVPKPFYQLTANKDFIYFFESGNKPEHTFQTSKVTQLNYKGEVVNISGNMNSKCRVFSSFTSDKGLHYVGHRFSQSPEYYLGSFTGKKLNHRINRISLPHKESEVQNWVINKSAYEQVLASDCNNFTWLKKAFILQPMSDGQALYSQFIKIDTSGKIKQKVEVPFGSNYRNFLGIDTEFLIEQERVLTVVLKGAKTGPYFDIYLKDFKDQLIRQKEIHFYDLRKNLREGYRYYDYHEIDYNHYRNVDHFKAVIFDRYNNNFILIDKVPDGTYFFYLDQNFELNRVDYAKEFSGYSMESSQFSFGILNGFSNVYLKEGYSPVKTAIDFIMNNKKDDPRNYYFTVLSRDDYQILIIDDCKQGNTRAIKMR